VYFSFLLSFFPTFFHFPCWNQLHVPNKWQHQKE
jgi:hypothetical protein